MPKLGGKCRFITLLSNQKNSAIEIYYCPVSYPKRDRKTKEVDRLRDEAQTEGVLIQGSTDSPPLGYWAYLRDPDGHTLEISYGQEISTAVKKFGSN